MTKILKELQDIEFIEGACNCEMCIRERLEANQTKLLLQIAPSIKTLPRIYDKYTSFADRNSGLRHLRNKDLWQSILRSLKALEAERQEIMAKRGATRYVTCVDCGCLHKPKRKQRIAVEGKKKYVCDRCIAYYKYCDYCKIFKTKRNFHKLYGTFDHFMQSKGSPLSKEMKEKVLKGIKWVCKDCYRDFHWSCYRCGFKALKKTFIEVNIGFIDGGDGLRSSDGRRIVYVCPHCEKEARVKCHECGITCYDFIGDRFGDDVHFCLECTENRTSIHEYYYKPSKIYMHSGKKEGKVTNKALHFGFELEVECRYSSIGQTTMAELIKEKYTTKYVYIVHDGSIDNGIEIVSHPFTWEQYKEEIDKWNDLLLFLRSKKWKANRPKVGFHVHMTKAAFTSFHLFKFLRFFYNEENRKFINIIAQREPNSYSVFSEKDRENVIANAKDKKNRDEGTHYNAINLNNPTTVEVRMFRGTLEPLLFNKNIEFLKAAFNFSRDNKPTSMTDMKFTKYVSQHPKAYPCLMEFLKMEGVIRKCV
jgi:hypothetical protein